MKDADFLHTNSAPKKTQLLHPSNYLKPTTLHSLLQHCRTTTMKLLLIISLAFFLHLHVSTTFSQSCASYSFASNQIFPSCDDLPYLNSSLHWDYNQTTNAVRVAYRRSGVASNSWTAWGVNPTSNGMIGTQALVAFQKSDGNMSVYTSPVSSYQTQLQEGELSFPVSDLTATYQRNEVIIFATLTLGNLSSTVNHVWQEGPLSGDSPAMHPVSGPNVQSMGSLNFLSGETTATGGVASSREKKRNIHGVLNAISWGILLPLGAILARYFKVFDWAVPAWFYLHVACQIAGYIIGVSGWATGIRLGSQSPGVTYTTHRVIGIVIFCLATIQVSAMLLRPKKDHKYRFFWNIYHHSFGYSIIILSIINIFRGFNILNPDPKWKRTYIGILIALAAVAAVLEVYTWCVVVKRKKANRPQKMENGVNGNNGYSTRSHDGIA